MKSTVFFLLMLILLPGMAVSQDDKFSGIWMGKLAVGGVELRIVFNIEINDSGVYSATMDSPDQGAAGIPVGPVEVKDDSLIIHAPTLRGEYRGLLESAEKIAGKWTQMGRSMVLDLLKQENKLTLNRPQEPLEPFPYLAKDVRFKNQAGGFELAGTLTLPQEGEGFAAVVLVSGSGQQNRDEEIFGHKPFKVIADYLTTKGIAVLRYDDRGVGGSGGNPAGVTSYDFMKDAEAAVEYLLTVEGIDRNKIGIIGHSEGGLIAPMLASLRDDIAFIILLAGPGTSCKQLLLDQNEYISLKSGVPDATVRQNIEMMDSIYNIMMQEEKQEEGARKIKNYTTEVLKELGNSDDIINTVLENMDTQLGPASYNWFRYFIMADPAEYLPRVKCPVLALNGEKDCQVSYKQNLEGIQKGLENNEDVTTKSFPDLNHLFQHSETGLVNEYALIEETFSPEVLEIMANWIIERF